MNLPGVIPDLMSTTALIVEKGIWICVMAIDSGGHVSDLVLARNCCLTRMLPGEAELVSE